MPNVTRDGVGRSTSRRDLTAASSEARLAIFLRVLIGSENDSPYLCGLIPGLIGVAMLIYVYFLAAPVE